MLNKCTTRIISFAKKERLILAIFSLGLFLRLLGTYPGYPLTHPDEPSIATSSFRMAFEANFKPQAYYYGQLLPLIYAITYLTIYFPITMLGLLPAKISVLLEKGIIEYIYQTYLYLTKSVPLHQIDFWNITYWPRYDSAVVGSLAVLFAYLVGMRLFTKNIGLITALLVAVNYRHVLSSRLVLADAPAATFALLAVYLFSFLLKKPSCKNYLLSGVAIALALSVKYFVYIIPAFILCHTIGTFTYLKQKNLLWRIIQIVVNYKLILAVLLSAILFLAINPYLLLAREEASYYWAANSARYGLQLSLDVIRSFNPSYYSLYYLFFYGIGPVLIITTFIGVVWGLLKFPKGSIIILSVIISFLYTFLIISGTGMVRNYSAIIPLLLFFPAIVISNLLDYVFYFTQRHFPKTLAIKYFGTSVVFLFLTLFLWLPLFHSIITGYHLSKIQNMIALYYWMDQNLPDGSKILGPSGIFYPAGRNFEAIKLDLNNNNLLSMEEIKKTPGEWLILNSIPWDIQEHLLLTNSITKLSFFNQSFLKYLSENNYNNLLFHELEDYQVARFVKPYTQDPPFAMVQIPKSWAVLEDNIVVNFSYNSSNSINLWLPVSYPSNPYTIIYDKNKGKNSSGALIIQQDNPHCEAIFTSINSPAFSINPGKWYTVSSWGKRIANPVYTKARSGYFRLNFYSQNGNLIKTYVSRPLSAKNDWQKLYLAGMAPQQSSYARIAFQIDPCFENEKYLIDEITIFSANNTPSIDNSEYHFYMKEKPREFEWVPQL